jgi:hypothetical protein
MSIRSFAKISLAVACILISVLPEARASTCSILEVHGANGKVGAGFGVVSFFIVNDRTDEELVFTLICSLVKPNLFASSLAISWRGSSLRRR